MVSATQGVAQCRGHSRANSLIVSRLRRADRNDARAYNDSNNEKGPAVVCEASNCTVKWLD